MTLLVYMFVRKVDCIIVRSRVWIWKLRKRSFGRGGGVYHRRGAKEGLSLVRGEFDRAEGWGLAVIGEGR